MELPQRKPTRLKGYDYSTEGAYFITLCIKGRKNLLSKIISGNDECVATQNRLSNYGLICDKYINNINIKYENVSVDHYVIMPNHIHFIIFLSGTMKASSPTNLKTIVRSFKTMVTKEIGHSIWQRSYHDHIIRDENDYQKIWEYINTNVLRWEIDCFHNDERS